MFQMTISIKNTGKKTPQLADPSFRLNFLVNNLARRRKVRKPL
jgi:hypothetical protein